MKSFLTRIIFLSFLLTLITINPLQAATERRLALVIGNGKYTSSPLRNPVNDAADMADALKKLGFNVILKTNADKREMGKAFEDFGRQLKGQDVGLFYYAGHGVQLNGVNYLMPVSAKINEETDVEYEAIDAGRALATMHNAKSRINIVILDACRDNPYVRGFRSATRGLAIIAKAPMGTIISYSTSPGDVALDGKGRNSPYTSSLLQYMKEPGLSIEKVFKNVRQKLNRETGGKQMPWELSSLQGGFLLQARYGQSSSRH
ncbi:MAG: caspase domain-containing protein [Deltaproteobacteria bacterium]|nr:caspase domain-containing protein [Deltaproteobacteria bacterium]